LAVLLQRLGFVCDREVRTYIALHESFHLAAQFYGGAVGFSRTTGTSVPENKALTDAYWHAVKQAVDSSVGTKNGHCSALADRYRALSDADRKFVVDRAFWEWPAEYFARSRIDGYDNPGRYYAIRRRMSEGDELYVVGSEAMGRVASIYGEDRSWQARVARGESALNVLLDALGCPKVPDDPRLIRVDHVDFVALDWAAASDQAGWSGISALSSREIRSLSWSLRRFMRLIWSSSLARSACMRSISASSSRCSWRSRARRSAMRASSPG